MGEWFLDDYAMLGLGFIALSEATGEPVWQARAQALASAITARFIKADGLIVNSAADVNLNVPAIDLDDHEMPSATSAAYAFLVQIGQGGRAFCRGGDQDAGTHRRQDSVCACCLASLTAYAALYGRLAEARPEAPLDSAAHVKATAHGVFSCRP